MTSLAGTAVGFVGLGKIGGPMAGRLAEAGAELTVHDVAAEAVARFARTHPAATAAASLRDLAGVEAAIASLPDSDAVESVVLGSGSEAGLADVLAPGSVVIDMSSSDPLRSRSLAGVLAERGLHFLDAPVSGGVARAATGSLTIMVGGDRAQFELRRDLLAQMGETVTFVGGPGCGHALKALNNYVSAAGLVATVEALLAGRAFGLDPGTMVGVLNSSTGRNYTTESKARQFMLSETYASGFSLDLMSKDVHTAVHLASSLDRTMRLGGELERVWADAAEALPAADHTEMFRFLRDLRPAGE